MCQKENHILIKTGAVYIKPKKTAVTIKKLCKIQHENYASDLYLLLIKLIQDLYKNHIC